MNFTKFLSFKFDKANSRHILRLKYFNSNNEVYLSNYDGCYDRAFA